VGLQNHKIWIVVWASYLIKMSYLFIDELSTYVPGLSLGLLQMIALLVPLFGVVGLFYAFSLYRESSDLSVESDRSNSEDRLGGQFGAGKLALEFGTGIVRTLWVVVLSAYLFLHFVVGFETAVSYLLGAGSAVVVATISHLVGQLSLSHNERPGYMDVQSGEQLSVDHVPYFALGLAATSAVLVGLGVLYFSFEAMSTIQALLGFGLGFGQGVLLLCFCSSTRSVVAHREEEGVVPGEHFRLNSLVLQSSKLTVSYLGVILAVVLMGRSIVLEDGAQFVYVQTPFVLALLGLVSSVVACHFSGSSKEVSNPDGHLSKAAALASTLFVFGALLYCGFCWLFFSTLGLWHWLAIAVGAGSFIDLSAVFLRVNNSDDMEKLDSTWCPPFLRWTGLCRVGACRWWRLNVPLLPMLIAVIVAAWCGAELEGLYCVGLALVSAMASVPMMIAKTTHGVMTDKGELLVGGSSSAVLAAPLLAMLLTFIHSKQSFQIVQTLGYSSWLQIVIGIVSALVGLQYLVRGLLEPSCTSGACGQDGQGVQCSLPDSAAIVEGAASIRPRSVLEAGRLMGLFGMLIPLCIVVTAGGDVLSGQLIGLLAMVGLLSGGIGTQTTVNGVTSLTEMVGTFSVVFFFVALLSLPLVV
jgi:hypothetical protein